MEYLEKLAALAEKAGPQRIRDEWRLALAVYGTAAVLLTSDGVEMIDPADLYLTEPTPHE